jgi:hypothetical protein
MSITSEGATRPCSRRSVEPNTPLRLATHTSRLRACRPTVAQLRALAQVHVFLGSTCLLVLHPPRLRMLRYELCSHKTQCSSTHMRMLYPLLSLEAQRAQSVIAAL